MKLVKQNETKKSTHALAGANIRTELKSLYPNCKFKVNTESYSGGSSVNVYWFDGVTDDKVKSIIDKYKYGSFDGMTDMYNYDKEHDGSYGYVKYAFSKRQYTKEAMQEAVDACGFEHIEVKVSDYDSGAYINDTYDNEMRVYQYLKDKSFYQEAKEIQTNNAELPTLEEIYKEASIEEFTHTKTNEAMQVLKIAHKLSKEMFNSFRNYMKQEKQAYYSRYAKGFVLPE